MSNKEIHIQHDAKEFDLRRRPNSKKRDFNCVGPPVPLPCYCGGKPTPRPCKIGANKKG